MDRSGARQVYEVSREQRKMEETGCEVNCGATTTPAVKGWVKMKGEGHNGMWVQWYVVTSD